LDETKHSIDFGFLYPLILPDKPRTVHVYILGKRINEIKGDGEFTYDRLERVDERLILKDVELD
jgi:hypothetical protein